MKNSYYQRAINGLNAQNHSRLSYVNGASQGPLPNGGNVLRGPERIFGLIATSTTNAAATAIFFGLARQGREASAGSGAGIAITGIGAIAHPEMKELTAFWPHELLELRLRGNAAATIPATMTISYRKAGGGKLEEIEVTPRVHQGSSTQDTTRAEVDFSGVRIDASFQLSCSIAANGTLDVYFITRKVIDIGKAFDEGDVVNVNYDPAPPIGPAQRLVVESAAYNKAVR